MTLPHGILTKAVFFEDTGPWTFRLPATIAFARGDPRWGKMNVRVSDIAFDINLVDVCSVDNQHLEGVSQ